MTCMHTLCTSICLPVDVVAGVSILPPPQALLTENASVPTDIQLIFRAVITTSYGTSAIGPVLYVWDFGDGIIRETRDSLVIHSYVYADTYTVTLSVTTPLSHTQTANYQLITYKSKTINTV